MAFSRLKLLFMTGFWIGGTQHGRPAMGALGPVRKRSADLKPSRKCPSQALQWPPGPFLTARPPVTAVGKGGNVKSVPMVFETIASRKEPLGKPMSLACPSPGQNGGAEQVVPDLLQNARSLKATRAETWRTVLIADVSCRPV